LNLKATFETGLSHFTFKRLIPGAFKTRDATCQPAPPHPSGITISRIAPWAAKQGLTLVHFSAQLEPFLTQNTL
jgi:hypothetical protein